MSLSRAIVLVALALLCFAKPLTAANTVENLVQPDLLSSAHSKIEADCSNCHKAFKKAAQSSLCADCHKPVKMDISQGTGFHGKNPVVKNSECANCHAEHKGRAFKQDKLFPLMFDHNLTDYKLDGRHQIVSCQGCHKPGKKFSAPSSTCFACHEKDQPHLGNLGKECESCHNTTTWKKTAPFDHDKTKFRLLGGHAKATCFACHVGEKYKGLPSTCAHCHGIQDVHEKRFGSACESCHTVNNWKSKSFDHGKFTKFKLTGAHSVASCSGCHGEKSTSRLPTACFECHKKQDVHKAQLGTKCESCHGTKAWRADVRFDHNKTRFALTGMHALAACEACHATPAFKTVKSTCFACHADKDVHKGRFATNCSSCHGTTVWKAISFDHGRDTRFALTGVHLKTGCYACHQATQVKSAKIDMACYSCHSKQDVHRGAFGLNCEKCHGTASFKGAVIRR
jgi:hypothetical protein